MAFNVLKGYVNPRTKNMLVKGVWGNSEVR